MLFHGPLENEKGTVSLDAAHGPLQFYYCELMVNRSGTHLPPEKPPTPRIYAIYGKIHFRSYRKFSSGHYLTAPRLNCQGVFHPFLCGSGLEVRLYTACDSLRPAGC
jgi:hypothetical protein